MNALYTYVQIYTLYTYIPYIYIYIYTHVYASYTYRGASFRVALYLLHCAGESMSGDSKRTSTVRGYCLDIPRFEESLNN